MILATWYNTYLQCLVFRYYNIKLFYKGKGVVIRCSITGNRQYSEIIYKYGRWPEVPCKLKFQHSPILVVKTPKLIRTYLHMYLQKIYLGILIHQCQRKQKLSILEKAATPLMNITVKVSRCGFSRYNWIKYSFKPSSCGFNMFIQNYWNVWRSSYYTQFLMHNGQFLPSPLNNIYCK